MTNLNSSRYLVVLKNAEKKIQRLNIDMENYLFEQPKIASQINYQTKKINQLKSDIKQKSNNQLLLHQELKKVEKQVKEKKKKTANLQKKLIQLKKSIQRTKTRLYNCKKTITICQSKLRKINIKNSDKKLFIQHIGNLIQKKKRRNFQARIAGESQRMLDLENLYLQQEDQIDDQKFCLKNSEKKQNIYEKKLFFEYDQIIKNQKILQDLENRLNKHKNNLHEASNKLERVIKEASNNDKIRKNLQYYLEKAQNSEFTEMDYYFLNKLC